MSTIDFIALDEAVEVELLPDGSALGCFSTLSCASCATCPSSAACLTTASSFSA